ncbi:hypothetical protein [Pontimicrobium sp. SW4]|uniref:DUF3096 domain-containing protein n=1 Tax=Pontimicrobium sp. SW4 TaxID=3153519 RepID=A0AAU7BVM5_9FLAO
MEIGKKEQLIIGIVLILLSKLFDWSFFFMLIGIVFVVIALSNNNDKQSDESKTDKAN